MTNPTTQIVYVDVDDTLVRSVGSSSLTGMTTPYVDDYGYGVQISTEEGALDISHNGTVDGFFSILDYIPLTRTTVVVLSNLVGERNQSTPGTFALDTNWCILQ